MNVEAGCGTIPSCSTPAVDAVPVLVKSPVHIALIKKYQERRMQRSLQSKGSYD